jgi:hypothetical protein
MSVPRPLSESPRWLNMVVSGHNEVGVDAAYLRSSTCRSGLHFSQK